MKWNEILKMNPYDWEDLGDVLTGEYDYEKWKDKAIPPALKELQNKFNSSPKGLQNDIKALFRDASRLSMKQKQQVFDMIKILLD